MQWWRFMIFPAFQNWAGDWQRGFWSFALVDPTTHFMDIDFVPFGECWFEAAQGETTLIGEIQTYLAAAVR